MRPLHTYDDWKYCITQICKVPLTQDFLVRRLNELQDTRDHNTQKFISNWGENHRKQVIAWLKQAEIEFAQAATNQ